MKNEIQHATKTETPNWTLKGQFGNKAIILAIVPNNGVIFSRIELFINSFFAGRRCIKGHQPQSISVIQFKKFSILLMSGLIS